MIVTMLSATPNLTLPRPKSKLLKSKPSHQLPMEPNALARTTDHLKHQQQRRLITSPKLQKRHDTPINDSTLSILVTKYGIAYRRRKGVTGDQFCTYSNIILVSSRYNVPAICSTLWMHALFFPCKMDLLPK